MHDKVAHWWSRWAHEQSKAGEMVALANGLMLVPFQNKTALILPAAVSTVKKSRRRSNHTFVCRGVCVTYTLLVH